MKFLYRQKLLILKECMMYNIPGGKNKLLGGITNKEKKTLHSTY